MNMRLKYGKEEDEAKRANHANVKILSQARFHPYQMDRNYKKKWGSNGLEVPIFKKILNLYARGRKRLS
jgi:hypothetical protein